jgi:hypothetical protein
MEIPLEERPASKLDTAIPPIKTIQDVLFINVVGL